MGSHDLTVASLKKLGTFLTQQGEDIIAYRVNENKIVGHHRSYRPSLSIVYLTQCPVESKINKTTKNAAPWCIQHLKAVDRPNWYRSLDGCAY